MHRLLYLILIVNLLYGQEQTIKGKLEWKNFQMNTNNSIQEWTVFPYRFEGQGLTQQGIPIYVHSFLSSANIQYSAELEIASSHAIQKIKDFPIPTEPKVQATGQRARGEFITSLQFVPILNKGRQWELIDEFIIKLKAQPISYSPTPQPTFTYNSVLSNGEIYKIAVSKEGIYKLDKNFLEKNCKLNLSALNPKNIHLLGNGGQQLEESNSAVRMDDLTENPIWVAGESDGVFNDQDYILFYAQGPEKLEYTNNKDLRISKNIYSNFSYYYIKIDQQQGLRIKTQNQFPKSNVVFNEFLKTIHHEKELVNPLEQDDCNHGSGQLWIGEELSNSRNLSLPEFIFPNLVTEKPLYVSANFIARAPQTLSYQIRANNKMIASKPTFGISYGCTNTFASANSIDQEFNSDESNLNISVQFPQGSVGSEGWLDYLRINAFVKTVYSNRPLYLFHPEMDKNMLTSFEITNPASEAMAWKIGSPKDILNIPIEKLNQTVNFTAETEKKLSRFVYFEPVLINEFPEFISKVENQNLHGLENIQMAIIYNSKFKDDALRLARHRENFSKLKVACINAEQIYNEFGSGTADPTAIKDFARMLYFRNPKEFKYLALFGDASYDFRHINTKVEDQNFIPTYETKESFSPISSFPSDDYFGLMDDQEGTDLTGLLDIAVGRLLARTEAEAKNIVDKIIRYDTDPNGLTEHRISTLFMADDEDGNLHFNDMDRIAVMFQRANPIYNLQKIYFDAYEQVTTPGGERYPEVTKSVSNALFQGQLIVSYMGHGGPTGLSQERALQDSDIKSWENPIKLPLVVTATCTFLGFDDPNITTAGEQAIHNLNGGALALFSTVRAVFANENYVLTRAVFDLMIPKNGEAQQTIGEILMKGKNASSFGGILENSRKFMLFGDPAQYLALPKLEHRVTSVNDKDITQVDSFKALQKVSIKGYVSDKAGVKQSNFQGKLFATVYDKPTVLFTRANDPSSIKEDFEIQKNIIFKGQVLVTNGDWEFSFIVPKDINYNFGKGKLSLYSTDEKNTDAASFFDGFIIGGFTKDTFTDDKPPVVKLFMNDAQFANGGITNENPKLYAQVSDDLGINISGTSIGHDMVAILDKNSQNPIILNTYFKTKLNDYKEGEVLYPLKNLSPGKHTLSLTAWDISNKMGEDEIEFNVISSEDVVLTNVYNYPNPFSKVTDFQFETNLTDVDLDVTIRIQSISGKIVKTIQKTVRSAGNRIASVPWDGKDDFGSSLANGVYLYRVTLNANLANEDIKKKSNFQKLVILR